MLPDLWINHMVISVDAEKKKTFNLNLTLIHDQITTQQTNKKKEHSEFNKRHK